MIISVYLISVYFISLCLYIFSTYNKNTVLYNHYNYTVQYDINYLNNYHLVMLLGLPSLFFLKSLSLLCNSLYFDSLFSLIFFKLFLRSIAFDLLANVFLAFTTALSSAFLARSWPNFLFCLATLLERTLSPASLAFLS